MYLDALKILLSIQIQQLKNVLHFVRIIISPIIQLENAFLVALLYLTILQIVLLINALKTAPFIQIDLLIQTLDLAYKLVHLYGLGLIKQVDVNKIVLKINLRMVIKVLIFVLMFVHQALHYLEIIKQ